MMAKDNKRNIKRRQFIQRIGRTGGLAALTHFVLLGSGEKKAYALIGDCTSQQTDDCETPSGDVCRPGSFGGNLDPDYCSPSDVPAENYADVCGSGTDASDDQCWNAGMESEYDDNCNGPGTLDNPDFCEDPWTNPVPDYCNYSAIPPEEMGDISHHG
jgi:hypothetical protein